MIRERRAFIWHIMWKLHTEQQKRQIELQIEDMERKARYGA